LLAALWSDNLPFGRDIGILYSGQYSGSYYRDGYGRVFPFAFAGMSASLFVAVAVTRWHPVQCFLSGIIKEKPAEFFYPKRTDNFLPKTAIAGMAFSFRACMFRFLRQWH